MIKELMRDPIFLAGKSEDATKEDITIANDKKIRIGLVSALSLF